MKEFFELAGEKIFNSEKTNRVVVCRLNLFIYFTWNKNYFLTILAHLAIDRDCRRERKNGASSYENCKSNRKDKII